MGALVVLACVAFGSWFFAQRAKTAGKATTETTATPGFTAASLHFEAQAPKPEPPPAAPVDTIGPQLRALLAKLLALEADMADLKNRKPPASTTTVIHPPAAPKPAVLKPPGASIHFVADALKEAPVVESPVPLYTLAPGATQLPCIVEPKIVSDVQGYFTCKVSVNVYDTKTGRHLLVPQGSTILANGPGQ